MHPKNKYQGVYNYDQLMLQSPSLRDYIVTNPRGEKTVSFSDPSAVKLLNKSLLKNYYNIDYWDIPAGYLVPPVPSRSDYIHHVAELIKDASTAQIKMLDIGTGANLIYPIVAIAEYKWIVVGTDIDQFALSNAQEIIDSNLMLRDQCSLRHQQSPKHIIKEILRQGDLFDIVVCNPPFHGSTAKADQSSNRKRKNLKYRQGSQMLNFGGRSNELSYPGGELSFLRAYISESKEHTTQLGWCTSLVSSHRNIPKLLALLQKLNAPSVKVIKMQHGQKSSHILCWKY